MPILRITDQERRLIPYGVQADYELGRITKEQLDAYIATGSEEYLKSHEAAQRLDPSQFVGNLRPPEKPAPKQAPQFVAPTPTSTMEAAGQLWEGIGLQKEGASEVYSLAEQLEELELLQQDPQALEKKYEALQKKYKETEGFSKAAFAERGLTGGGTLGLPLMREQLDRIGKIKSLDPDARKVYQAEVEARKKAAIDKYQKGGLLAGAADPKLSGGVGLTKAGIQSLRNWEQYLPQATGLLGGIAAGAATTETGPGAIAFAKLGQAAGAAAGSVPIAQVVRDGAFTEALSKGATVTEAQEYATWKVGIEFGAEVIAAVIPGAKYVPLRKAGGSMASSVGKGLLKAGTRQAVEENVTDAASSTYDMWKLGQGDSAAMEETYKASLPFDEQGRFSTEMALDRAYQTTLSSVLGGAVQSAPGTVIQTKQANTDLANRQGIAKEVLSNFKTELESRGIGGDNLTRILDNKASQLSSQLGLDKSATFKVDDISPTVASVSDEITAKANEMLQGDLKERKDDSFTMGQMAALQAMSPQKAPPLSTPVKTAQEAQQRTQERPATSVLPDLGSFAVEAPTQPQDYSAPGQSFMLPAQVSLPGQQAPRINLTEQIAKREAAKAQQQKSEAERAELEALTKNRLKKGDGKALAAQDRKLREEIARLEKRRGIIAADPSLDIDQEIAWRSQIREGIRQTSEANRLARRAQEKLQSMPANQAEPELPSLDTTQETANKKREWEPQWKQATTTATATRGDVPSGVDRQTLLKGVQTLAERKPLTKKEKQSVKERSGQVSQWAEIAKSQLEFEGAFEGVEPAKQAVMIRNRAKQFIESEKTPDQVRRDFSKSVEGKPSARQVQEETARTYLQDSDTTLKNLAKSVDQDTLDSLVGRGDIQVLPTFRDATIDGKPIEDTGKGFFRHSDGNIYINAEIAGKQDAPQELAYAILAHEKGHETDETGARSSVTKRLLGAKEIQAVTEALKTDNSKLATVAKDRALLGAYAANREAVAAALRADGKNDQAESLMKAKTLSDFRAIGIDPKHASIKGVQEIYNKELAPYFIESLLTNSDVIRSRYRKYIDGMVSQARDVARKANITLNIRPKDLEYVIKQELKAQAKGEAPKITTPQKTTFKTALGSTYEVNGESTTRTKSDHTKAGHSAKDVGKKRPSDKTFYVPSDVATSLSSAGLVGKPDSRVFIKDGKAFLTIKNETTGKWGISPSMKGGVPIKSSPEVGLAPLEVWDQTDDLKGYGVPISYKNMHAGNKIVEVNKGRNLQSVIYGIGSQKARHEIAVEKKGFEDPIYKRKVVEISDKNASINTKNLVDDALLSDVLNHKDYYDYHPKARDYTIKINPNAKFGEASFDQWNKVITISGKTVDALKKAEREHGRNSSRFKKHHRELISSIIHEKQHYVQSVSIGFAERGTSTDREAQKYNKRTTLTSVMRQKNNPAVALMTQAQKALRADNAAWWMYMANAGEVQARAIQKVFEGEYTTYQEAVEALSKQFPLLIRNDKDRDAFIDWWENNIAGTNDEFGGHLNSLSEGTVEVDGKDRPRTNSLGNPIALDDESIVNFWRWFGDSRVVDSDGKPLVVYHGSPVAGFNQFDLSKINPNDPDAPYNGFWFSGDQEEAFTSGAFPWGRSNAKNPEVRSFYLALQKPATKAQAYAVARDIRNTAMNNGQTLQEATRENLQKRGYDGIFHAAPINLTKEMREGYDNGERVEIGRGYSAEKDGSGGADLYNDGGHITGFYDLDDLVAALPPTFVAFRPEQIKSAIGNNGKFSKDDSRINYSLTEDLGRVTLDALKAATVGLTPKEMKIFFETHDGVKKLYQAKMVGAIDHLQRTAKKQQVDWADVEKGWQNVIATQTLDARTGNRDVDAAIARIRVMIDDMSQAFEDAYAAAGIPLKTKTLNTIQANMGKYVSRSFEINYDKNYGAKLISAAEKDPNKARILRDLTNFISLNDASSVMSADTLTDKEVKAVHNRLFGTGGKVAKRRAELKAFAGSRRLNEITEALVKDVLRIGKQTKIAGYYQGLAKNEGILKHRSVVPSIVKEAWGERTGIIEQAMTTIIRQGQLLADVELQATLLKHMPDKFSAQATDVLTEKLPSDVGLYGPLANQYTTPAMKRVIQKRVEVAEAADDALFDVHSSSTQARAIVKYGAKGVKAYTRVIGAAKVYTVMGEFVNYLLNQFGAVQTYTMRALFADTSYTGKSGKKENWNLQYAKDVLSGKVSPKTSELYQAMLKHGMLGTSLGGDVQEAFVDKVKHAGITRSVLHKAGHVANVAFGGPELLASASAYAGEINFLRALWEAEGKEFTHDELMMFAADRAKNSMISRDRAFNFAKALDRFGPATYLTFFSETIRAPLANLHQAIQTVKQAKSPKAKQLAQAYAVKQALGASAMLAVTYGGMQAAAMIFKAFGAHDFGDEPDEIPETLGDRDDQAHSMMVIGEDAGGAKLLYDMSMLNTYSALYEPVASVLRGEPEVALDQLRGLAFINPLLRSITKTVMGETGPVSNELIGEVNEILSKSGFAESFPRATGAVRRVSGMTGGVEPSWFMPMARLATGTTDINAMGGGLTAAMTLIGGRPMRYAPQKALNRVGFEFKEKMDAARTRLNEDVKDKNSGPETVRASVRNYYRAEREALVEMYPYVQAALANGMKKEELQTLLKDYRKNIRYSLMSGEYAPTAMTDNWLEISYLASKANMSPKDKKELLEGYRRNKGIFFDEYQNIFMKKGGTQK